MNAFIQVALTWHFVVLECIDRIVLSVVCVQSFDDLDDSLSDTPKKKQTKKEAESPGEASKAQIAKIEAELTKILKDSANDDMSYAGNVVVCLRVHDWISIAVGSGGRR